ncbi:MAG: hypothetical protein NC918_02370 [Candidatus Omnitrophica bacterium]|nr:hypothetical protein [Candidatus Omnitrophota bacterium]
MKRKNEKLGQILLNKKLITPEALELVLEEQKNTNEFLGELLIKYNYIKEKDLLIALSEQFDLPIINLANSYIDMNLTKKFSATLIVDHKCFPIKIDDFSVTFAINNPLDAWTIKKAEEEAGALKAKFVLVTKADLEDAIKRYKQYMRGYNLGIFEK